VSLYFFAIYDTKLNIVKEYSGAAAFRDKYPKNKSPITPLPWREGIEGRGNQVGAAWRCFTLTPTLSRQGRGGIKRGQCLFSEYQYP